MLFFAEQSDANQFTVAARLQTKSPAKLLITKSIERKCPPMIVFKSANQPQLGLAKSPSMMVTGDGDSINNSANNNLHRDKILKRSVSVPGGNDDNVGKHEEKQDDVIIGKPPPSSSSSRASKTTITTNELNEFSGAKVAIPKLDDDETFAKFFTSIHKSVIEEGVEISDFDTIKSNEK